jgi:putative Holliday junction resolvase
LTRLLGIDLGARRIGLAVGDTAGGGIRALGTLRRGEPARDARSLATIVREQRIDELVVGLPLLADGREGGQAAITRAWVTEVGARVGLPLTLRDERLTSVRAEAAIGAAGRGSSGGPPSAAARNAHRALIDRTAAALIVEAELEARRA